MSFFLNFKVEAAKFKGSLHSEFNKPFRLRGDWEVGVYACHMPSEGGNIWVMSDIVDFSYVNEIPMRVMDVVLVSNTKNGKPIYSKVIRKTLSSINIEFKQDPSSETLVSNTDITCILHFRKA